ncbi:MAG: cation:proton antiporter [Desulfobacteraceae bacterium]|nr:cation:proton antiporter [Desulfobacteraceae bacterium]
MTGTDALNWIPPDISAGALSMVILGFILSLSIFANAVANRTHLPRISLLVLLGVGIAVVRQVVLTEPGGRLLGGLGEYLIELALVMVAFLLGSELTVSRLRTIGPVILAISLAVTCTSVIVVGFGLLAFGFPLVLAVPLAAISVATDPAAVSEVVRSSGDTRVKARVLSGIVAIDDGWGIIVYGLAMAFLGWVLTDCGQNGLVHAGWELGGALLLGCFIGLPAAWLTGHLEPGEPTLVEAVALILLLAGLSFLLGVSSLMAAMIAGVLIANLSTHHTRSFNEIKYIEWPFLVFFFVLSGASLDLYQLDDALGLTAAYILLRLAGRFLGGLLGVKFARRERGEMPGDIGLALTPQAGVAMGMALLAAERFPECHAVLIPVVVTSTILFEVIGPVLVRRVLR